MNALNTILRTVFDLILSPLSSRPLMNLIAVSVLAGVLMTLVFRFTSNQRSLRKVADRSRAMMTGMRLFKDNLRVTFGYQGDLLKLAALRLWYSIPPMLVMIIPFALVLAQLALRYEHRPLAAGESVIVEVHASEQGWPTWRSAAIEVPDGVKIETPALRDEKYREVSWRIQLVAPTDQPLRWRAGDMTIQKAFVGRADVNPVCTVGTDRPATSLLDRLIHAGERSLEPASQLDRIVLRYPQRTTPVFGIDLPWWATFLIVSMATALICRPFLKVQF